MLNVNVEQHFRTFGNSCRRSRHFFRRLHREAFPAEPFSGDQDVHLLADGHHPAWPRIPLLLSSSRLQRNHKVPDRRLHSFISHFLYLTLKQESLLYKEIKSLLELNEMRKGEIMF